MKLMLLTALIAAMLAPAGLSHGTPAGRTDCHWRTDYPPADACPRPPLN